MFVVVMLVSGCKKNEVDVFANSTLPTNYTNQGTITVKGSNLKICIWDWSVVDGDVIDLIINGRTMLANYEVTDKKDCIDVVLPNGENWIGIKAINEGTLGAASPRVEISDGKSVQGFDISGYINKPGGYKIKVVL